LTAEQEESDHLHLAKCKKATYFAQTSFCDKTFKAYGCFLDRREVLK
jgi:hypothetical protein